MNKTIVNEEDEAERIEKNKNLRLQELEDVRRLLLTPEGVRFIRRVMNDGKPFADAFTGNSQTFYNCGKQAVSREILADIVYVGSAQQLQQILKRKEGTDEVHFPLLPIRDEQ